MNRIQKRLLILCLVCLAGVLSAGISVAKEKKHHQISVLLRDGSVITTPDLQPIGIRQGGAFSPFNRYIRIRSLSIDGLVFIQGNRKHVFNWEQIVNHIHSIELLSPELDTYQHGLMTITPKKGKAIRTEDATLLEYLGHDQSTSQIMIEAYDSYNKWWRESYLDIQKVRKIVFGSDELLRPAPKPAPVKPKSGKKSSTTAEGIAGRLMSPAAGRRVDLDIEFGFNSAKIRKESISLVRELGKALVSLKPQGRTLWINGHTDSDGSAKYNLKLSKKRAEAVKRYLKKHFNLKKIKIRTRGYGETRPIAPNRTAADKQKNRRVEVRLK